MAGITTQGFVAKTLADCKAELEAAFRLSFGNGINLTPPSTFATLVGIVAEREADLWQLAESVYNAFDPLASTGASLDALAELTGTVRQAGETDSALRVRRIAELRASGNAAVDAIRAALLRVPGVTAAVVYENTTDSAATIAGLSMAPHTVSAVVAGGTDADVRNAIFASKAAGIDTAGSNSGTVTDAGGFTHTVRFDRPTAVRVWATAALKKDAAVWTSANNADRIAAVKAALVAAVTALPLGADLVYRSLFSSIFGIAGVKDVTYLYLGASANPVGEVNVTITGRQIATLDAADITVAPSDWSEG